MSTPPIDHRRDPATRPLLVGRHGCVLTQIAARAAGDPEQPGWVTDPSFKKRFCCVITGAVAAFTGVVVVATTATTDAVTDGQGRAFVIALAVVVAVIGMGLIGYGLWGREAESPPATPDSL